MMTSKYMTHPINSVRWVPLEKVAPNNYNPNNVARVELHLLYISIKHDGFTQPIVTFYDKDKDIYIIVDGFHRYFVLKTYKDILESTDGMAPVVVIDKDINNRMASTVRHNRARGKHTIAGMSNLVFTMLENGWSDKEICNELGMEAEEILRLKHITGFSKLFKGTEYKRAWMTARQIKIKQEWEARNKLYKLEEEDEQSNG